MKGFRLKNVKRVWSSATLYKHKARGYKVLITQKELLDIIERTPRCVYCGVEFDWEGSRHSESFASLDRTDNEMVLRADNSQIICRLCNRTKQNRTHSQFLDYCNLVVQNNGVNLIIGGE